MGKTAIIGFNNRDPEWQMLLEKTPLPFSFWSIPKNDEEEKNLIACLKSSDCIIVSSDYPRKFLKQIRKMEAKIFIIDPSVIKKNVEGDIVTCNFKTFKALYKP